MTRIPSKSKFDTAAAQSLLTLAAPTRSAIARTRRRRDLSSLLRVSSSALSDILQPTVEILFEDRKPGTDWVGPVLSAWCTLLAVDPKTIVNLTCNIITIPTTLYKVIEFAITKDETLPDTIKNFCQTLLKTWALISTHLPALSAEGMAAVEVEFHDIYKNLEDTTKACRNYLSLNKWSIDTIRIIADISRHVLKSTQQRLETLRATIKGGETDTARQGTGRGPINGKVCLGAHTPGAPDPKPEARLGRQGPQDGGSSNGGTVRGADDDPWHTHRLLMFAHLAEKRTQMPGNQDGASAVVFKNAVWRRSPERADWYQCAPSDISQEL